MHEGWLDLKTKTQRKRTSKSFTEYNDYRDRPFGLKWGTDFAIDELNQVITDNKVNELKVTKKLQQMSRREIDEILQLAYRTTKRVMIQLNQTDEYGNYYANLVGDFKGFADADYLYINDKPIEWNMIRNIQIFN